VREAGATQVEHLKEGPIWGRLLASPTNIRLGCGKGSPEANTLAYYENL
jgi:hypothetical protein